LLLNGADVVAGAIWQEIRLESNKCTVFSRFNTSVIPNRKSIQF
jgi:hypothetical protein